MTELRKTIMNLIAANKVEKAIDTLRESEIISSNNRINSQITMLSSRYESLKEDSIKGILSASEKSLQEAKINNDILELLENLENPPTTLSSNSASQKTKINSFIGIGGLLLFVFISFYAWSQMDKNQDKSSSDETTDFEKPEVNIPESKPVLLPRKFKIEPKSIQILNGNDGSGGDPEIYGWVKMGIGKRGDRNNLKTIFNRPKSNYLTMKDGVNYPTDATGEFLEIEVSPEGDEYLLDQYEFFLSADLTESDDGGFLDPDDRIGNGQVVKSLKDLANGENQIFTLQINSSEGNVSIITTVSEVKN